MDEQVPAMRWDWERNVTVEFLLAFAQSKLSP